MIQGKEMPFEPWYQRLKILYWSEKESERDAVKEFGIIK